MDYKNGKEYFIYMKGFCYTFWQEWEGTRHSSIYCIYSVVNKIKIWVFIVIFWYREVGNKWINKVRWVLWRKYKWMMQKVIGSQCFLGRLDIFETLSETWPSKSCFHDISAPLFLHDYAVEFSRGYMAYVILTD